MTRRTSCGACDSGKLHKFLDLGETPIADAYTATRDEISKLYPLELAVCVDCRLVQLLEVVDSQTLFGTGYSFYSSASPPLSAYHQAYADDVLDRHDALARRLVVEIGCNDGDMLRWFNAHGRTVVGVDPAAGPVEVATRRGLDVWRTEFTLEIARELRETYGEAGVIIANHVLAHVADVSSTLGGIAHLLADDGVALVEVQYLPDMLVNNAFDLVYHEHRNFFTLTSIWNAARRHGLVVVDARLTQRQGGSLRVTLRHGTQVSAALPTTVSALRYSESWLRTDDLGAYAGVQGRVERVRARLLDIIDGYPGDLAGYGAPAKATTLLNFCGISGDQLDYVVDTTPAKQGRFIPGTGIPIVRPEETGVHDPDSVRHADAYLLLAWNYARDIMHRYRDRDVDWIVPIPAPVLL